MKTKKKTKTEKKKTRKKQFKEKGGEMAQVKTTATMASPVEKVEQKGE